MKILIQNLECRSELLNLDVKQYKQREIKRQKACKFAYDYEREGEVNQDQQVSKSVDDDYHDPPPPPEIMYECKMCKKDGSVCGRRFAGKQSLLLPYSGAAWLNRIRMKSEGCSESSCGDGVGAQTEWKELSSRAFKVFTTLSTRK